MTGPGGIPEDMPSWVMERDLNIMAREWNSKSPAERTEGERLAYAERRAALLDALRKAAKKEKRKPRRPGDILSYVIVSRGDLDELREDPDKNDVRWCQMTRRMEAVLCPGNTFRMDYWPHPDTLYPAFAELSRLGVFYYESFHEFSTRVGIEEGEIGNHRIPARAFEDPSSFTCAVRDLDAKLDPQGIYRFTVPHRSHSVIFPVMAGMSEADSMILCSECGKFMEWLPRGEPVTERKCKFCAEEGEERDCNERLAA